MTPILTDLSPPALTHAVKANLYAFFDALRASPAAEVQADAQALRWHTAVPHPWFNGVLSAQPPGDDAARMVQDALGYFRARDVGSFTWWLAPDLEPEGWSAHLLAHGFRTNDQTPGMALDLAALPPPAPHPLIIRHVDDRPTLDAWGRTFMQGYGMPESLAPVFTELLGSLGMDLPLRHYLGWLDGRPVAASSMFVAAGVAGIFNVATLPEARRRGLGSAMTLAPLFEARDLGYRAAVLQSSDMGYPVYERLGFTTLCRMDHFYWASGAEGADSSERTTRL